MSGGGELSVTQSQINTDNVTEGSTNLFTTAARTRTHFTYGTGITHSSGTLSVTQSDINTDNITEGSTNVFFTNARADARADLKVAAATGANLNLGSKSTSDLSEGTNQYYTEARVQAKLDNAFAQLSAMLNNLATTTTLTLNLSGDPTPGAVVATTVSNGGGGGFSAATAVATSGAASGGAGLTVNTTVDGNGNITAAAVNAGGSDYLITDTVTITNANAGKVLALNLGTLSGGTGYTTATGVSATGGTGSSLTVDITASSGVITNVVINNGGTGYVADETVTILNANASGIKTVGNISAADAARTAGTYTLGASDYGTEASGANATFTVVVDSNGAATITVTDDGSGFIANETVTVADAQLGGGGGAALTFDVTAIHGNGATVNTSTVATNATLALSDITTMEVGATVTGATSGTTGVITALGTNAITVDNVDGFFKSGEVVAANDVSALTITSFS